MAGIFAKYIGSAASVIARIVGTGNITVTTSGGTATVDGSALAKTDLSNLANPTAVSQTLSMVGGSTHADLLFPAGGVGGSIGVGLTQTSGTDYRPQDIYVSRSIQVGNTFGVNPPYASNNPLVTGSVGAGNQTNVVASIGSNTFWNSVALGGITFIKDGGGVNALGFINLDSPTDMDVYFSILHRTSAKSDLLKFGSDGSLSLLAASGANLLWGTDGGGDIGSPDGGTTLNRPNNLFVGNYGQIGTAVNLQGPSAAAGYLEAGNTTDGSHDTIAFMGALGGYPVNINNAPSIGFTSQTGGGRSSYLEWMWPGETNYIADGDVVWWSGGTQALIFRATGEVNFPLNPGIATTFGGEAIITVANVSTQLRLGYTVPASVAVGSLANKLEVFDANGTSLGFVPIYSTIT